jgi:hypothetical protein
MQTRIKKAVFILLISFTSTSLRVDNKQNTEPFYFFLAIDYQSTKSGKGYMSKLIYYPGYVECNKLSDVYFKMKAKGVFEEYMKSTYSNEFSSPYGINSAIKIIATKRNLFDRLKTISLAEERVAQWTKDEQRGNFVKTNCVVTCND